MLNEAQIMSRYPEDIATFAAAYNFDNVAELIAQSKEILQWIKQQF